MVIDFNVKPRGPRTLEVTSTGAEIFEAPHACEGWTAALHREAAARFDRAHEACRQPHLYAMVGWHRDCAIYGTQHPITLKTAKKAAFLFKQYLNS